MAKDPIKLDYATPLGLDPRPAEPAPIGQDGHSTPAPVAPTGVAHAEEVLLLATDESAAIAAATRQLDKLKIAYRIVQGPPARGRIKPSRQLLVRQEDEPRARPAVLEVLKHRARIGGFQRQDVDAYKTRSQGGIWPEERGGVF